MSRRTASAATWLLACGTSVMSTLAIAATLKETPPKGVELHGLWQLDVARSDDPDKVLADAKSEMVTADAHASGRGYGGGGRYPRRGGGFPDGGTGGGFPGGGGGGWGHGGGRHRSSDSSGHSEGDDSSSNTPSRSQMLKDLISSPRTLDFSYTEHTLRVSAEQASVECAAGVKVAISDAAGPAERHCGWDGRAWVIETERGKALTRTDRYDLSKDGKTLTYTTTARGARLPKIKFMRTYTSVF